MLLIVTRPRAQAAAWVRELRALGQAAASLPLIEIGAIEDTGPLRQAWRHLHEYALVVFVSANAVQHFMAAAPAGSPWPAGVLAGSTGPGTSAALRGAGVPEAVLVEPAADTPAFDSEALWARVAGRDWAGRRVFVVRGEDGRDWLADTLRARGATVDYVAAYRRQLPTLDAAESALLQSALAAPAAHRWLFSSSEAVGNLQRLACAADWSRISALATHPRIVRAALQAGFGQVELTAPAPAAVVERLRLLQAAPIESSSP